MQELGPLCLDIAGLQLSAADIKMLRHPLVGGIVLFTRNYKSLAQLSALCAELKALRTPELMITVDHEGGRVQRFLPGFTALPTMQSLGDAYLLEAKAGLQAADLAGFTMASELRQCGVEQSFAPVLDLDMGLCDVLIGGRAICADTEVVTQVARAFINGMHRAGMPAVGKHFPGHGNVQADSHLHLPVDTREFATIQAEDMQPFMALRDDLQAIMPAHIIFSAVDKLPASLSPLWLKDILRNRLGFRGMVFSDCLSMQAAVEIAPDVSKRVQMALDAGCDMALICNNLASQAEVLDNLALSDTRVLNEKIASFRELTWPGCTH
jgi:beta-N-acetylhexosaminidase